VLTLDSIDWSKQRIADYLGITWNQVRWAIARGTPTPHKPPGRVPKLISSEVDDIITFITANEINRRLSYEKLIFYLLISLLIHFDEPWLVGDITGVLRLVDLI